MALINARSSVGLNRPSSTTFAWRLLPLPRFFPLIFWPARLLGPLDTPGVPGTLPGPEDVSAGDEAAAAAAFSLWRRAAAAAGGALYDIAAAPISANDGPAVELPPPDWRKEEVIDSHYLASRSNMFSVLYYTVDGNPGHSPQLFFVTLPRNFRPTYYCILDYGC